MKSVDKKAEELKEREESERLREKYNDVFENPSIDKIIELRYRHEGKPNYKSARVPVTISDEAYSEKFRKALPILLKKLNF